MRLEILPFVFLKHFKVWAANSTLADKRAIWDPQFWVSFGSRTCSQLNVLKHPVKHPVKHPETMWVCPIKSLSVYHHFPRFLHGHKLGYPWIFLIAGQNRSVLELFLIMSLRNGWYINISGGHSRHDSIHFEIRFWTNPLVDGGTLAWSGFKWMHIMSGLCLIANWYLGLFENCVLHPEAKWFIFTFALEVAIFMRTPIFGQTDIHSSLVKSSTI